MSIYTAFSTKIQAASEVYLNRFLVEKGYLRFSTADPEPFEALQGDSQAFALDPSRIYVPVKKRYPRDLVPIRTMTHQEQDPGGSACID